TTGWSRTGSAAAPARAPPAVSACPRSERGELDADADAVGIDVGLAGGDAQRGGAAPRCGQVIGLADEGLLQVEAAGPGQRADLGAQEIIIPGLAALVDRGEALLVDPDLDGDQQPLRHADLEIVKADIDRHVIAVEHDLARPGDETVGDEAVQPGDVGMGHRFSRNWTSRGRARKRWPPSSRMVWPVMLGVAIWKRKAATISSTRTPRPKALSPCTLSKLARLCGPDTIVTDGAIALTRICGAKARAASSVTPARPYLETV